MKNLAWIFSLSLMLGGCNKSNSNGERTSSQATLASTTPSSDALTSSSNSSQLAPFSAESQCTATTGMAWDAINAVCKQTYQILTAQAQCMATLGMTWDPATQACKQTYQALTAESQCTRENGSSGPQFIFSAIADPKQNNQFQYVCYQVESADDIDSTITTKAACANKAVGGENWVWAGNTCFLENSIVDGNTYCSNRGPGWTVVNNICTQAVILTAAQCISADNNTKLIWDTSTTPAQCLQYIDKDLLSTDSTTCTNAHTTKLTELTGGSKASSFWTWAKPTATTGSCVELLAVETSATQCEKLRPGIWTYTTTSAGSACIQSTESITSQALCTKQGYQWDDTGKLCIQSTIAQNALSQTNCSNMPGFFWSGSAASGSCKNINMFTKSECDSCGSAGSNCPYTLGFYNDAPLTTLWETRLTSTLGGQCVTQNTGEGLCRMVAQSIGSGISWNYNTMACQYCPAGKDLTGWDINGAPICKAPPYINVALGYFHACASSRQVQTSTTPAAATAPNVQCWGDRQSTCYTGWSGGLKSGYSWYDAKSLKNLIIDCSGLPMTPWEMAGNVTRDNGTNIYNTNTNTKTALTTSSLSMPLDFQEARTMRTSSTKGDEYFTGHTTPNPQDTIPFQRNTLNHVRTDSPIVSLAVGAYASCAIVENTLQCWGRSDYVGGPADPVTWFDSVVDMTGFLQNSALVLKKIVVTKTDPQLAFGGMNVKWGPPTFTQPETDIFCLLADDYTNAPTIYSNVYCWGPSGTLGRTTPGTTVIFGVPTGILAVIPFPVRPTSKLNDPSNTNMPLPLGRYTDITVSKNQACVLTAQKTFCWGFTGPDKAPYVSSSTATPSLSYSSSENLACYIDQDSHAQCSGIPGYALGDFTSTNTSTYITTAISPFFDTTPMVASVIGFEKNNNAFILDIPEAPFTLTFTDTSTMSSTTVSEENSSSIQPKTLTNTTKTFTSNSTTIEGASVPTRGVASGVPSFSKIVTMKANACGIDTNQNVWCWGFCRNEPQSANGNYFTGGPSTYCRAPTGESVSQNAIGIYSPTRVPWVAFDSTFSKNSYPTLSEYLKPILASSSTPYLRFLAIPPAAPTAGMSTTLTKLSPTTPYLDYIIDLFPGLYSICALRDIGPSFPLEVFCWGNNNFGLLANGSGLSSSTRRATVEIVPTFKPTSPFIMTLPDTMTMSPLYSQNTEGVLHHIGSYYIAAPAFSFPRK